MKTKAFRLALKAYSLVGVKLVEQGVHWDVVDERFRCAFMGEGRQYAGEVDLIIPGFPPGTYGVTNSAEWVKLLDIMGDDFELATKQSKQDYCAEVTLTGSGF